MKLYKTLSLVLMLIFAMTGLLFLFLPDKVMLFFNSLSGPFGLTPCPVIGWNFYLILAVGYMYLVALLALGMFRHPENRSFPLMLTQAKLVSSLLSLAFFLLQARYLIYLANFVVDGLICIVVLTMCLKLRKKV